MGAFLHSSKKGFRININCAFLLAGLKSNLSCYGPAALRNIPNILYPISMFVSVLPVLLRAVNHVPNTHILACDSSVTCLWPVWSAQIATIEKVSAVK
eukprot:717056-Amphidinium_carterae.1